MKRFITATLLALCVSLGALAADGHKYVVLQSSDDVAQKVAASGNSSIFIIRNSFNLKGKKVNLPDNAVVRFEGGELHNGTLVGKNTSIDAGEYQIFGNDLKLEGKFVLDEFPAIWYGAIPNSQSVDLGRVLDTILRNLTAIYPRTEWSTGHGYGGITITLPTGTFYDSTGIDLVNYSFTDLTIRGAGKSATTIINRIPSNEYMIKNSTSKAPWGLDVSDISFINGSIFSLITPYDVHIHNCKFLGNNYAILVYLTVNTRIDNCLFVGNTNAITVSGNAGLGPSTTFFVEDCWMQHCTKGIQGISNTNGFTIYARNTIVEYCSESVHVGNSSGNDAFASFDNCYFEGNTSGEIYNVTTVFENCFVDSTDGGFKFLKAAGSRFKWTGNYAPKIVRQQNAGIDIELDNGYVEDFVGRHHVVMASSIPTARIEGKYARIRFTADNGMYEGMIVQNGGRFVESQKICGNLAMTSKNGTISFAGGSNPKIEIWY